MARVLYSAERGRSTPVSDFDYRAFMLSPIPESPSLGAAMRSAQGGGPPPGGYGPPRPGGYGPPPGPGGYGSPPGGYGPPGSGGYGSPPGGYGPPAKPITGSAATMELHAMTIDPKTGLPRGEKPPASTAAVVSLVCGILLCLGPFTGIPAIVAGVIARKAAREAPQTAGGSGMAMAGIVLGVLNLFLTAIACLVFIWQAVGGE